MLKCFINWLASQGFPGMTKIAVKGYQSFNKTAHSNVIYDHGHKRSGTPVLIEWTAAYQELIITTLGIFKLLTQSRNMLSRTFTKKGQFVSFYTLNNLLQITLHKYKSPGFSTFPVAVQNVHFLKVKVKCYSKKRMFPIEKYIYFYSVILMIDCKLD